jgi:nucleoside-triphosphatase THEP1
MERLGLVLGLSLNVFPQLADATRQVVLAWRVRRRSTRIASPSPLQLMEVLLAHVARIADEAAAAAALRGHSALVYAPVAVTGSTLVVVATGRPESGKTTAVQRLVNTLRSRGYSVRGILQPGRFEDGSKTGFAIHDLDTGEETDLAGLVERGEGDHGTRFRFAADGFALAERALAKVQRGDILVVDELGPLELRGQGHSRAVQRALQVPGLAGVVLVVRSQLVPALLANLRVDDAAVVDVATRGGGERLLEILTDRQSSTQG